MTLPLFLIEAPALAGVSVGDPVTLSGPEARHATRSMRLQVGEEYLLGDGEGTRARLTALATEADALTGRVEDLTVEPEPECRFVLVQALAKGGRDEQAVETAVELGVDAIVPWQAERSIVQWRNDKAAKGIAKWRQVVAAATKQSRRARAPQVRELVDSRRLPALVGEAAVAYLLHEDATTPLAGESLPAAGDVLLIVGPEGGMSEREVQSLVDAGARLVRLGSPVLRSSTAGPAAIAVLSAASRWS